MLIMVVREVTPRGQELVQHLQVGAQMQIYQTSDVVVFIFLLIKVIP